MEEWQRRLVDPNWGGGKFGAPGIGGEGLLMASLPGIGYRQIQTRFINAELYPAPNGVKKRNKHHYTSDNSHSTVVTGDNWKGVATDK